MNDAQDAARYRILRAYSQAVRDHFKAHPEAQPGEPRPWFGTGVILCLTGEELDSLCDERIEDKGRSAQ